MEVDDYTKQIPQSIPNKEWDMFGSDYRLAKEDYYPIKTYTEFETEQEKTEEKKIDPVAGLLEAMAKIKKGEQLWIQLLIEPVGDSDELKFLGQVTTKGSYSVWRKKGEVLRDELARREEASPAQKSIIQGAAEILISGAPAEEKKEEREFFPPEMKLTPGEREVLAAMEKKMSKQVFSTTGS